MNASIIVFEELEKSIINLHTSRRPKIAKAIFIKKVEAWNIKILEFQIMLQNTSEN